MFSNNFVAELIEQKSSNVIRFFLSFFLFLVIYYDLSSKMFLRWLIFQIYVQEV